MPQQIDVPGMGIVEFPDGMNDDQIASAIKANMPVTGLKGRPFVPNQQAGDEAVGFAKDIGRAVGGGLVTGAGAVPDIANAARGGFNYLLNKATGETPPANGPNVQVGSPEMLRAAESVAGPLGARAATTEPGKKIAPYAQTAAEFLPMSLMTGGGVLGGAVLPGIASEGAGQATKGTAYEPYARAGGGIVGALMPAAARKAITPFPTNEGRQAAVQQLQQEGVTDLTAGQRTGRRGLQYYESEMGGQRGAQMGENAGEQFTQAVLNRVGENAPRATPDVIHRAGTRIGQQFDDLAARNNIAGDQQLGTDLVNTARDYFNLVGPSARAPIVENTIRDITHLAQANGGTIPGAAYQELRSRLGAAARSARGETLEAIHGLRGAIDDAMERSLVAAGNHADLAAWQEARNQYRNLLVVERAASSAGADAASGILNPQQMRAATVGQNRRAYVRGQGDFADLVHAGNEVMTKLPQSGTAPRLAAQGISSALGALTGGYAGGAEWSGPGAIAGLLAPRVAGRLAMTPGIQGYLANQRIPQGPAASERILRALMASSPELLPEGRRRGGPSR